MIEFTDEQEDVINKAVHHIHFGSEQVFQLSGGPGTGKTEVIHEIVRRSKIPMEKIAPMAFIGQAAIVMRTRGLLNARTIHSWLYDIKEKAVLDAEGKPVMDPIFNKPMKRFVFVPKDLSDIDLFIIDEGSTVPLSMKEDIESRGKKIIVCGDIDQLPPVKDQPAYLLNGKVHYLTKIMRQKKGSYIIELAKLVLNGIEPPIGLHGNVLVIDREDLTNEMLMNSQVVICGTNKTRDFYNDYIRRELFGRYTRIPTVGDRVMCRKNNWNIEIDGINLTNGLTGTVIRMPDVYDFDGKIFTIDFRSDLMNLYFPNIGCDYKYFIANRQDKELIKSSKYSIGEKFEFAYAKTAHLCQGSQYYNGIYISEYMPRDIQQRLDFTGVTRFINHMIYVLKPRKRYF